MPTPSIANYHNMLCRSTHWKTYTEYYLLYLLFFIHLNLIILLNLSPFESPKGLNTKYSVPQHLKIHWLFRGSMHLEAWGQEGYIMYWFVR